MFSQNEGNVIYPPETVEIEIYLVPTNSNNDLFAEQHVTLIDSFSKFGPRVPLKRIKRQMKEANMNPSKHLQKLLWG